MGAWWTWHMQIQLHTYIHHGKEGKEEGWLPPKWSRPRDAYVALCLSLPDSNLISPNYPSMGSSYIPLLFFLLPCSILIVLVFSTFIISWISMFSRWRGQHHDLPNLRSWLCWIGHSLFKDINVNQLRWWLTKLLPRTASSSEGSGSYFERYLLRWVHSCC